MFFATSCGGHNKPDLPKDNIKSVTKDIVTSPGSNEKYHTKYKFEYTDSIGKSLIIQNSFPRDGPYTDPTGKIFGYGIFWTRVINETATLLELTINFPADSFAIFPSARLLKTKYHFKSGRNYYDHNKLDTLTISEDVLT